jgi:orotidine-5'-phosphate decarboxylase
MAHAHFADRLIEECRKKKSQVVVGLDPRMAMMPSGMLSGHAGRNPAEAADCIVRFNEAVLDEVREIAAAVKVQIAFYERFGREGLRAYSRTLQAAREKQLLVIGDVKRNDIGSTAAAYAEGHLPGADPDDAGLDWPAAGDFQADAITVNPLFGSDGVRPFLDRAVASGSGVFVLVRTSNPSSGEIQDLRSERGSVYERTAELVGRWGEDSRGREGYSLLGAVAGATFPEELSDLRERMPHTPFLVPGFGAQGGGVDDVLGAFDSRGEGAVVNSSRGIIYAFRREPYKDKYGEKHWRKAVREAAESMRRNIWRATH